MRDTDRERESEREKWKEREEYCSRGVIKIVGGMDKIEMIVFVSVFV